MYDRVITNIGKRAAIIIAVMVCAYEALVMFLTYATLDNYANDFVVYWDTAHKPLSEVYEHRPRYPFPYMPTMLLWIKPLSLVDALPAYVFWIAVSALTFTWATRKYLTMGQNLLALISRPVLFCLATGQVSVFLAGIMLWAFGTSRKAWAGVALGLIASIKPQLVLLAPLLLLLRRDFRMTVAAGASFTATVLAALLAFGDQPWVDWLESLDNFRAVMNAGEGLRDVPGLAGQAERAGYPPLPFMLFGLAFGSWLVYRCRNLGALEVTAAVATASIFAAPYSMTYDLVAVVPFLAVMAFRNRITAAVALTALFHPLAIFLSSFELLRKAKEEVRDKMAAVGLGDRPAYGREGAA